MSSASASTKQVVMNSTNNSLATFRFTETSNVENVKISQLIISGTSTNAYTRASFINAKLYQGATAVGGPVNASSTAVFNGTSASSSIWAYVFNLSTPVIVPQNSSLELELKADVASNSAAAASSSAVYQFKIYSSSTDVTAIGQSSNTALAATSITLSNPNAGVAGNLITVVRSKLTLSAATIGATSARTRMANDDIANLTFTADTADPLTVNTVALKFPGHGC